MKSSIAILIVLFLAHTCSVQAQDKARSGEAPLAAVQAADDARVAAMLSPSREKLDAIFSPELHYAHSTGEVDTKDSFIAKLTSGKTKYLGLDYEKRNFTFPAAGIALMTGRVHIRARTAETTTDSMLSILAVWRLEHGSWRFLAWQSCKLPPK